MNKDDKDDKLIPIPEHLKGASREIISIYKDWYTKREALHNSKDRYIGVQSIEDKDVTVQVDLIQAYPVVRKRIRMYPKIEQDRIMESWSKFASQKSKIANLKNKWDIPANKKNKGVGTQNLEPYIANIIELFGTFKTAQEIKKILADKYAYDISMNKINEVKQKNLDKIKTLKSAWEESVDEYSVTHKKGQIERLVYLMNTQLDEYKRNDNFSVLRSREIRAILEQIWNILGGNKIVVDINQKIDITSTINMNMSLREITRRVSINSFIVALVAVKYGQDPFKIMHKLENSYFKAFNGFTKEAPTEEMFYPSGLINQYNWDEIKRKHDNNEIPSMEVIAVVEPEPIIPAQNDKKSKLLELMGNKVNELEKNKAIKKEK